MGSSHSRSISAPSPSSSVEDISSQEKDSAVSVTNRDNSGGSQGLSGMPLVHHQCRRVKRKYDICVRRWYSKEFMTGEGTLSQEEACGDHFDDYRSCILRGIRKEVWDKEGLPAPSEMSPLADVAEDGNVEERG